MLETSDSEFGLLLTFSYKPTHIPSGISYRYLKPHRHLDRCWKLSFRLFCVYVFTFKLIWPIEVASQLQLSYLQNWKNPSETVGIDQIRLQMYSAWKLLVSFHPCILKPYYNTNRVATNKYRNEEMKSKNKKREGRKQGLQYRSTERVGWRGNEKE